MKVDKAVETLSIKILNKKSRNTITATAFPPPKGNNKLFKDFYKDFLNKKEISNKANFVPGDFNFNALDFDTKELVKEFFNQKNVFQNVFLSLIQRPVGVTRKSATAIDHVLTNTVLENKIQFGIIKTDIIYQYSLGKMNEICSLEKIKFIKNDISSEKILMFLNSYDTAFPKRETEIKTQHLWSP